MSSFKVHPPLSLTVSLLIKGARRVDENFGKHRSASSANTKEARRVSCTTSGARARVRQGIAVENLNDSIAKTKQRWIQTQFQSIGSLCG